jgi:hypothetical protein
MWRNLTVAGLLMAQMALIGRCAWSESPNSNEVGNLPAGISHWELGEFRQYPVNPPFVKLLASLPALVMGCITSTVDEPISAGARPEHRIGMSFIRANRDRWFLALALGRMACLPLVSLGGFICWSWARELWGEAAGMLALALWCFDPNILAWGTTISTDAAATSLGVMAAYRFWRWLREPQGANLLLAGLTLGLAELTKTSWLILFGLWPLMWFAWRLTRRMGWCQGTLHLPIGAPSGEQFTDSPSRRAPVRTPKVWQLLAILALGLYILNAGYGFEGSFQRLGRYNFVSHTLAGDASFTDAGPGGNRFVGTFLEDCPIPIPQNYLSGIDLQKVDFERQRPQYLNGEWKIAGWRYFYLEALLLKEPVGTLLLFLLALGGPIWRVFCKTGRASAVSPEFVIDRLSGEQQGTPSGADFPLRVPAGSTPRQVDYRTNWRDELVLMTPAVAVFVLVSVNCEVAYLRYALPCLPFSFIWISQIATGLDSAHWKRAALVAGGVAWSLGSTLSVYPYNLSYFNELAGGPLGGHRYLIDASIDWGQDLFRLKNWYDAHPDARPLSVALNSLVDPELVGMAVASDPPPVAYPQERNRPGGAPRGLGIDDARRVGPQPGWYAMSVHRLHDPGGYAYFIDYFQPIARVGYSIYIYHLELSEVNRARQQMGFPLLPAER